MSKLEATARNHRLAILIGNEVIWADQKVNVGEPELRRSFGEFEKILTDLGEYSFAVYRLDNLTARGARTNIVKLLQEYSSFLESNPGDKDTCLLVYYFGHGLVRPNGLKLAGFRQSANKGSNTIPFSVITDEIKNLENIPRTILVVDCCFAGESKYSVQNLGTTQYCLLASSTKENLSYILGSDSDNPPMGAFSALLFEGLKHPDAADPETLQQTPRTWFDYAESNLSAERHQRPEFRDGGLASYIFNVVETEATLNPEFSSHQPPATLYRKIYWICDFISENPCTMGEIYRDNINVARPPKGFLTQGLNEDRRFVTKPISLETFVKYVDILRKLRLVKFGREDGEQIYQLPQLETQQVDIEMFLSDTGKRLIQNNGSEFNLVLVNSISDRLQLFDIDLRDIETIIRRKWAGKSFPTAARIYDTLVRVHHLSRTACPQAEIEVYLDLLYRAGYLRATSQTTFYP